MLRPPKTWPLLVGVLTFPGGAAWVFIVKSDSLAETIEGAIAEGYRVATVTPPSEVN